MDQASNALLDDLSFHDQLLKEVSLSDGFLTFVFSGAVHLSGQVQGACRLQFEGVEHVVLQLWSLETKQWTQQAWDAALLREVVDHHIEGNMLRFEGFTMASDWFELTFQASRCLFLVDG